MELFDSLLHDPDRSEFVIVCIATGLSSAESGRLATKLLDSNVALRHIVVNQVSIRSASGCDSRYADRLLCRLS